MKIISMLLMFSVSMTASSTEALGAGKFGLFEAQELSAGQCGCWYHYPQNEGAKGKVFGLGEALKDSITFKIDGQLVRVGNWRMSPREDGQQINYESEDYRVTILSKTLRETEYSTTYHSTISIESSGEADEFDVFGSCGC